MNNKYLENGNVTKREIWVDYLKAIAIFSNIPTSWSE